MWGKLNDSHADIIVRPTTKLENSAIFNRKYTIKDKKQTNSGFWKCGKDVNNQSETHRCKL